MFSVRVPSETEIAAFVQREQRSSVLSYPEVGATKGGLPGGYRHDRWETDLGADDADRFGTAAAALSAWCPQLGAGIRISPPTPVAPDLTFALVLAVGPLTVLAGARIVYVVNEADRWGFAYGTLTSHPEQGEEYFGITRTDGRVRFEIIAFSRPRHPLARLGGPITRWLQVHTTRRYMEAMRRAAA